MCARAGAGGIELAQLSEASKSPPPPPVPAWIIAQPAEPGPAPFAHGHPHPGPAADPAAGSATGSGPNPGPAGLPAAGPGGGGDRGCVHVWAESMAAAVGRIDRFRLMSTGQDAGDAAGLLALFATWACADDYHTEPATAARAQAAAMAALFQHADDRTLVQQLARAARPWQQPGQ